jgi:glycosyltransferase involved in cell wall biosynthesis
MFGKTPIIEKDPSWPEFLKTKVSIIMSAYNEEDNISKSIESILNQTYRDFEFIIINDGSTDETEEIIKEYQKADNRIYLISKMNTGLGDSLTIGISQAKGEYIARMDADDVANEKRLGIQADFLGNNPEIALVGSWCYLMDLYNNIRIECKPPTEDKDIRKYLQRDNPFIHSSVMFRRHIVEKVGFYSHVEPMEDYEFWIRVAGHYKVANIPMFLITRYENRNLYKKYTYKGLNKYDIYSRRLKYQLEAVKSFGFWFETPLYLSKTIISILLCRLGLKR